MYYQTIKLITIKTNIGFFKINNYSYKINYWKKNHSKIDNYYWMKLSYITLKIMSLLINYFLYCKSTNGSSGKKEKSITTSTFHRGSSILSSSGIFPQIFFYRKKKWNDNRHRKLQSVNHVITKQRNLFLITRRYDFYLIIIIMLNN